MGDYDGAEYLHGISVLDDMMGLHADSIRKRFAHKQVLNDIYITCKTGEITGLLGRNGAGKSTLLKIIFGSLRADTRFISIDVRKVHTLAERSSLLKYLPQQAYLPPYASIKALVKCFCKNGEKAREIINHPLIKPNLHKKVYQLSGGEGRVLEVLLLLFSEAKYLLLDEPFSGLSPLYIDAIKELILERAQEKGLIITDHQYPHVLDISTKLLLLDQGNIKPVTDPMILISEGYAPAADEAFLKRITPFKKGPEAGM